MISIHTPTKGVTGFFQMPYKDLKNFNPHSHEGSDDMEDKYDTDCIADFNPHSHEGSDCRYAKRTHRSIYFNPHSHEGSDVISSVLIIDTDQFQSTLPRRE